MPPSRAILAIDPAWTIGEPSGVALLVETSNGWRSAAVAPSYRCFLELADGQTVDWHQAGRFEGHAPNPASLLIAARALAPEAEVALVTVDMPVATVPFDQRRQADRLISQQFGSFGCATHSPSAQRPGHIGRTFSDGFTKLGFPVATALTAAGTPKHHLEVYPHSALLRLLNLSYRFPYKVSRNARYWPNDPAANRRVRLLQAFREIHKSLETFIAGIEVPIPGNDTEVPFSRLKRFEDALDALICAWVGICYLGGVAEPYGDETAAIWVPHVL